MTTRAPAVLISSQKLFHISDKYQGHPGPGGPWPTTRGGSSCTQCRRRRTYGWRCCVRKDRLDFGRFSLSVNFSVNPLIQIVGCQPEASPVMLESVRAGRVVDWESKETLSGFSMRTMSCWMWWSSGRIMSRLLLIFFWRAKRLSQVFLWWGCCVVVLIHCD